MGIIMATYLDNAGVTQILTKIKSLLTKKAEITAIPTKVSQLTNDSNYQDDTEVEASIATNLNALRADSSRDSGFKLVDNVTANDLAAIHILRQTNGKISGEIANLGDAIAGKVQNLAGSYLATQSFVNDKITSAVDKITSFEYKVVSELPPESDGVKGTIYLLRHGGNDNTNSFDEYILVDTYTGADGVVYSAHYEKIGTTDIDLTPYAKKTEIPTNLNQLSNADTGFINAQTSAKHVATEIGKLDYSDTAVTGQYVSSVSETDGVIKVTRANLPAAGTADTPISNTTIESIFTQVFG